MPGEHASVNRQTPLQDAIVRLQPLASGDFERLYAVANDPLLWAQHPNPDRWQREVFEVFFKGAIESGGAYAIIDRTTDAFIGSTRYYDFDAAKRQVLIGYTFLARNHWGTTFNRSVKRLMLDHAFASGEVDRVLFQIGIDNRRSRIAIERLGAVLVRELETAYFGETVKRNVEYAMERERWTSRGQ